MKLQRVLPAAVAALALTFGSTSCLGPDNAYRSLKNWNVGLTNQDWLDEVIFIGLHVIPVYPLAMLGDVLIFNTVEYWSGDNPIKDPGAFEKFSSKD